MLIVITFIYNRCSIYPPHKLAQAGAAAHDPRYDTLLAIAELLEARGHRVLAVPIDRPYQLNEYPRIVAAINRFGYYSPNHERRPDLFIKWFGARADRLEPWRSRFENVPTLVFENGVFKIKLVLPSDYPQAPPKGHFLTKIFHPNISKAGEICVNTLKKDWKADLGIGHVLQVVRCLLINPFAESALNEEAGKLFMEEYDAYFKRAQMMTEVHAAAVNKGEASSAGVVVGEGGEGSLSEQGGEKRQKQPVDAGKAAEKKRQEKKKSLKRL